MPTIDVKIDGTQTSVRADGGTTVTVVKNVRSFKQTKPEPSRGRKPKGILPPKPYSFSESKVRTGYFRYEFTQGGHRSGDFADDLTPGIHAWKGAMDDRCINKALGKLKGQRINLGVAMAEAQQTATLVGNAAKRIAKSVQAFKQKKWKSFLRASKAANGKGQVPQDWLELQYGWKPLMQDVKGAWDELQTSEPWSWVTTVRAEETLEEELILPRGFPRTHALEKRTFRSAVVLSYRPKQYALQSIARLGLSNPAELVWEKVPFSFVVDWFLPVGSALHALDATVGFEFLHGSHTRFQRASREDFQYYGSHTLGKVTEFSPGYGEAVNFSRSVYGSSPGARLPTFKNPLSLGHMANGLSLLSQVFGGRK